MSALCCIFNRDGQTVDSLIIRKMNSKLSEYGADGSHFVEESHIAMGAQLFWTTEEECEQLQPVCDGIGNSIYTFCGRLDNRNDLIHLLDKDDAHKEHSDSRLTFLLWKKFRLKAFKHIVGPFTFIVFDKNQNRVTLARDSLGERTVFYYCKSNLFLAASEPIAILAHPEVPLSVHKDRVRSILAYHWPENSQSTFSDIHELAAGCHLQVDSQKLDVRRYWQFSAVTNYSIGKQEAQDGFREVLNEAIKAQTRSHLPIHANLSGGLDSNVVVALASQQVAVKTFSWIFEELTSCDERKNIEAAINHYNLNYDWLIADNSYTRFEPPYLDFNLNSPFIKIFAGLRRELMSLATRSGPCVLLTGDFGDELFPGYALWLRDYVRSNGVIQSIPMISKTSFDMLKRQAGARGSIRNLLPSSIKLPRWKNSRSTGFPGSARFDDELLLPHEHSGLIKRDSYATHHNNTLGNIIQNTATEDLGRCFSIAADVRRPYRDRRVVSFVLGLPKHVSVYPLYNKPLLREGMKDILPPQIATSKIIGGLRGLAIKGIEQQREIITERYNSLDIDFFGMKSPQLPDSLDSVPIGEILNIYLFTSLAIWQHNLGIPTGRERE